MTLRRNALFQGPTGPIGPIGPQGPAGPAGNISLARTAVSTNYTILSTDEYISVDATAAARTVTLPNPGDLADDQQFVITVLGASGVTLDAGSGRTINGLRYQKIREPWQTLTVRVASLTTWEMDVSRLAHIDIRDFGAVGDGVTDDTAALQAALNYFSGASNPNNACLYIPFGVYCHTGLTLIGSAGNGFVIRGEALGRSPYGSVLKYIGADGGTAFEFRGVNSTDVCHVGFDGGGKAAKINLLKTNQLAGGAGLSGLRFYRCNYNGAKTDAPYTLIELGHVAGGPTYQVSECEWHNCNFYGDDTDPAKAANGTGWRTMVGGNTKNFKIVGPSGGFAGLNVGVDWSEASGTLEISSIGGGNIVEALFKIGGASCTLRNCAFENANVGYKQAKFVGSDGAPGGTLAVEYCYADANLSDSSDNVGIEFPGHLKLEGNKFRDLSDLGPFKIRAGNCKLGAVANDGSIFSLNNIWSNSDGRIVAIDGSDNDLTGADSDYAAENQLAIYSFGDSDSSTPWQPYCGILPVQGPLCMRNKSTLSAGATTRYEGQNRTVTVKRRIPYTALKTNATSFTNFICVQLPDRSKLLGVVFDVTTAFVLPTSTYVLLKANAPTFGDLYAYQDVTSAIAVGSDVAHLTTAYKNAMSQGGYYQFTGSAVPIYLVMASDVNIGNGTVTNFTAGSIDLYLTYEIMGE